MTAGSSPGTSEIASVATRAGYAAAARRPPFMADGCLRRQFISSIGAPDRNSASVIARLSFSARPAAGSTSNADAPRPNEKQQQVVLGEVVCKGKETSCGGTSDIIRQRMACFDYLYVFAVDTVSIPGDCKPDSSPFHCVSAAWAMDAAAFPADRTTVLPRVEAAATREGRLPDRLPQWLRRRDRAGISREPGVSPPRAPSPCKHDPHQYNHTTNCL